VTFLRVIEHVNELLVHVLVDLLRLAHQILDVCLLSPTVEIVYLGVLVGLISDSMNHFKIIDDGLSKF